MENPETRQRFGAQCPTRFVLVGNQDGSSFPATVIGFALHGYLLVLDTSGKSHQVALDRVVQDIARIP